MAQKLFGIGKSSEPEPAPAVVQTPQEPPKETMPPTMPSPNPPAAAPTTVPAAIPARIPEADESSTPVRPEKRPRAFVVMPFGKKKGGNDFIYDFNAIYQTLIKPALEEA